MVKLFLPDTQSTTHNGPETFLKSAVHNKSGASSYNRCDLRRPLPEAAGVIGFYWALIHHSKFHDLDKKNAIWLNSSRKEFLKYILMTPVKASAGFFAGWSSAHLYLARFPNHGEHEKEYKIDSPKNFSVALGVLAAPWLARRSSTAATNFFCKNPLSAVRADGECASKNTRP